ncbi:MAG: hypothetical protein WD766_00930 [Gemmatimonadota bacterium]
MRAGHTVSGQSFTAAKTAEIRRLTQDRFGIEHATIQLELEGEECETGC